VQAICDYVNRHIAFNYQNARADRSAAGAFNDRTGVCRDYAHLAITFCRCMNIPARYCTGYLSDLELRLLTEWAILPRGSRRGSADAGILSIRATMCRAWAGADGAGRDACDVAIATTFGPNELESFKSGPMNCRMVKFRCWGLLRRVRLPV